MRRSQKNPQGGRLSKEMPIAISNVLLVCTACGKPTRTGARFRADGTKERYCKKCKAGDRRDRAGRTPRSDSRQVSDKRLAGKTGRDAKPRQAMRNRHERKIMAKKAEEAEAAEAGRRSRRRRGCWSGTRRKSCRRWPRSSAARIRMSLPRLEKIVVNMGVGSAIAEKKHMEDAVAALAQITGQKPLVTKSRKCDRRLPLARGHADRLQGDAARHRGCTSFWTA